MLDFEASTRALRRLYRRRSIADLDTLCTTLETRSRMTVFRRLKVVGYYSSITHRGRFYTLKNVPSFDDVGLWFYEGVGFSDQGNLKETVVRLVARPSPSKVFEPAPRGISASSTMCTFAAAMLSPSLPAR